MEEIKVEEGFKPKSFKDFSKNKGPFENVEIIGMSTTGFVAGKMPDGTMLFVMDIPNSPLSFAQIEKINESGLTLPIVAVLETSADDAQLATKIGILNPMAQGTNKNLVMFQKLI